MSVVEIQRSGCVEPERAHGKSIASGETEIQSNVINDTSNRYLLYPTQQSFDKAFDTEKYSQSLNYKSLEPLRASILDNISDQVWIDKSDINIPVAGRKCCCRSVWCPSCFRFVYKDKIKRTFEPFNWQFTRQVVLTIDPSNFPSPIEAFNHIRQKRSVGEFVRRLRRGVRKKIGKYWIWKYKPVNILRWAWFLEWHSNGFPHFHVFLQLDKEGKSGIIGGDFLRDSWSLSSWVREDFFRSDDHFKNLTGYYAGKGYFEKHKQHQGILPDVIMDNIEGKIKRYGSSEKQEDKPPRKVKTESESNILLNKNYKKCVDFFKAEKVRDNFNVRGTVPQALNSIYYHLDNTFKAFPDNKSIHYRVILERCGSKTIIELDLKNYRLRAECNLNYDLWKSKENGQFVNGRGIVNKLNLFEVEQLLSSVTRVISITEYMDIYDYCRQRNEEIQNKDHWRNHIMMDRD